MPLRRWKRLTEEIVARNPWWVYKRDTFQIPPSSIGREYYYVHTNGSAMVLPVMDDGRLVLVNQYRYLVDRESVEFPCGSVKDGSTHDETARHELSEETGYSAGQITCVGEFNPYNGITTEMCRVYVARELKSTGGVPDETEEFEIMLMTPGEIDQRIGNGTLWDGMSIAAWALARRFIA